MHKPSWPSPRVARRSVVAGLAALGLAAALAAPAAAQQPRKVRLAMSSTTMAPSFPYIYIADHLGYWKAEGLDVELLLTQGSAQTIQLLAAGQADAGILNPEPVIAARARQNLPIKSIAAIGTIFSWSFGVLADSDINSIADLKGKKVGVVSLASGGFFYLKARAQEAKLDIDKDMSVIPVGFGATASDALTSKKVDTLLLWKAAWAGMENLGVKFRNLKPADWEADLYSFIVAATDKTIAEQGDALTRLLRGVAKASEFAAVRPEAAAQVYWQRYPESLNTQLDRRRAFENDVRAVKAQLWDMALFLDSVPKPPNRIWGGQGLRNWSALQDYLKTTGQLDQTGDPAAFFTDQFTAAANQFDRGPVDAQARDYKTEF